MTDYRLPSLFAEEALGRSTDRIVDVRKPPAAAADGHQLAGAAWIDPYSLNFHSPLIRQGQPLIFYCAHGHEVSQFATALALVAGVEARYVRGGYEALCAAGAPVVVWEGEDG